MNQYIIKQKYQESDVNIKKILNKLKEKNKKYKCQSYNDIKQEITIFLKEERIKYNIKAITLGVFDENLFRSGPIVASGESLPNIPNTVNTHYRLGGQSIPIMTILLLILQDNNYLILSDTIDNWLPCVPNSDKITLKMLGNSTSGLKDLALDNPEFLKELNDNPFKYFSKEFLLQIVVDSTPLFEPGTNFHFTPHTNLLLLGLIMEMVTCKEMKELLKIYITGPLKLSNTNYDDITALISCPVLHAFIIDKDKNQIIETTYWSTSFGSYSTGTTSNVGDMMVLIEAIAKGELITCESYKQLIAPTTVGLEKNTRNFYYALGLLIGGYYIDNNPLIWINQSFNGYNGIWGVIPSINFKIHIQCNTSDQTPTIFADNIFEDFLNYFDIPYMKKS